MRAWVMMLSSQKQHMFTSHYLTRYSVLFNYKHWLSHKNRSYFRFHGTVLWRRKVGNKVKNNERIFVPCCCQKTWCTQSGHWAGCLVCQQPLPAPLYFSCTVYCFLWKIHRNQIWYFYCAEMILRKTGSKYTWQVSGEAAGSGWEGLTDGKTLHWKWRGQTFDALIPTSFWVWVCDHLWELLATSLHQIVTLLEVKNDRWVKLKRDLLERSKEKGEALSSSLNFFIWKI